MLHTLKAMEVAFIMAHHSDKFDSVAYDFKRENARMEDDLQLAHEKLETKELKCAKHGAKIRDLTGEVGELKGLNHTLRDDLAEASMICKLATESTDRAESELAAVQVEVAKLPTYVKEKVERLVQSDEMTDRTGVKIATCLTNFVQSYEDELPSLPNC